MDLLGLEMPEVVHYSFVLLKGGKMSTRQGKVVLLEDFMKEDVRSIFISWLVKIIILSALIIGYILV